MHGKKFDGGYGTIVIPEGLEDFLPGVLKMKRFIGQRLLCDIADSTEQCVRFAPEVGIIEERDVVADGWSLSPCPAWRAIRWKQRVIGGEPLCHLQGLARIPQRLIVSWRWGRWLSRGRAL